MAKAFFGFRLPRLTEAGHSAYREMPEGSLTEAEGESSFYIDFEISFEHAEADFAARLLIEARNKAETVIRATEKSLRSPELAAIARTELAAGELQRIEAALSELKGVLNGSDRDTIQARTHALNEATQHLAEVMMNRSVKEALTGKSIERL